MIIHDTSLIKIDLIFRFGFARSIYDRLRDEYKDATSITQTELPAKVLEYCRGLFTDELYQQLMSVTNQI